MGSVERLVLKALAWLLLRETRAAWCCECEVGDDFTAAFTKVVNCVVGGSGRHVFFVLNNHAFIFDSLPRTH
jgi:hypothetical protein